MKKTKSILICVLSALLTLSLAFFAACGGGTTSGSGNSGGSSSACEHKNTYVEPKISATCTTEGRGYLTCKDCGTQLSTEATTIPAKGHNYVAGFCMNCSGEDPTHKNFYVNALDFTTLKTVNVSGQNVDANLTLNSFDEKGNLVPSDVNAKITIENGIIGATSTDKEYFANIGIKAEGVSNLSASILVNDALARVVVDKDGVVTNLRLNKAYIEELVKPNEGENQKDFNLGQIKSYIETLLSSQNIDSNKALYNLSRYFFSAKEEANEVIFTLDFDAIRRLNENLADQDGQAFIDGILGKSAFQNLSKTVSGFINNSEFGLSEETKNQINAVIKDLETKSIYEVFATKDGLSADDIKQSVDSIIDAIKEGLSVEIRSDKDGKIKSVAIKVANFNVSNVAKALYPEKNIQTATISGTLTLTSSTETVSVDYADKINALKNATDIGDNTTKKGDYNHSPSTDNDAQTPKVDEATPITTHYKIENGNVVSVKTVYRYGEKYFSIECSNPLLVCSMVKRNDVGGDQPMTIRGISVLQFVTIPTGVAGDNGNGLSTTNVIKGGITVHEATAVDGGFTDGEPLENIPVSSSALSRMQFIAFAL